MRFIQNGHAAGYLAALLAAGALVQGVTRAEAQPANAMPFDIPVTIDGVEIVCTGVGLEARGEPRWAAYPLKVEFAGKGGQYLGNVHIAVSKDGKGVVEADCGGPWMLFKLPAGRYQAQATIEGQTSSSAAYVPATGQGRIILRFPQLGGALESSLNGPHQGGVNLAARTD